MAASVGSPPSYWASITPSSLFYRRFKLTAWQYARQRNEIHHPNDIKGRMVYGVLKSKAGLMTTQPFTFAASEGKSLDSEVKLDALDPETSHLFGEVNLSESNAILLADRTEGKPGFISFHGLPYQKPVEILGSGPSNETPKILLFIAPTVLVAFLVFPSLYLRRVFSTVFEDSLLTDFLMLFFTEALFYGGVAIFLLLLDHVWSPLQRITLKDNNWSKPQIGLHISSVATLVLSLIIPLVTMGMVWPWTGPAASATLAPYLVGLVVQFAFEQYARYQKSPACRVIPVIFQVYRLHQLNRAAQLVTALSFSVRGAETTPQTMAINSSLGTLLTVLQILGVICIWSLSSFLMRFLPSEVITES